MTLRTALAGSPLARLFALRQPSPTMFPEGDPRLDGADITLDGEPAHWATSALAGEHGWAARPASAGGRHVRFGHVVVTTRNGAVVGRAA